MALKPMKWGDGMPVTAKDIAFTLEVGKHPLSGVASSEGYKRIVKFDIKDDLHFTVTIDRVTFDYDSFDFQIVPAHIEKPIFDANPAEYRNKTAYDTDPTNPGLAFGPYRIVELVPGNRIVLEQNPTWTGEKPHFKRLVVKIIENTAALEANLLSGNVDYVLGELGLSLDQALAFEKRHKDKYNVIYKPALIYEHIDVNLDNPLLEDRRVRQAILLSIDRKAINDKLFEGKQPVANSDISPLDPMYSQTARHYGYDPAAAKKLLDEAGFATIRNGFRTNAAGERFSIEITTTAGNRIREQVAQVIQSQLRQVGIELRIKAEPPRIFSEALNRRNFTGLAMYAWVSRAAGRAALDPAFAGDPDGQERLERPELSRLRQSRDGQGARRRRARARQGQAPRPVRRHPEALRRRPAGAADVLPRRSLRHPQAAEGRACRPAISTARRSGSSSGAGRTRVLTGRARRPLRAAGAAGGAHREAHPAGGAASRDLHRHDVGARTALTIPISTMR